MSASLQPESGWRQAVTTVVTAGLDSLSWLGGGLGVIIESNLNRVRLSCYWVGFMLGQYIQVSKGDVWG